CMCWRCRKRREYQNNFLAAASRRELYCEMSFHAAAHKKTKAPQLMNGVSKELPENPETNGWWSTLAQAYSLSFWFSRFQSSLFPEQEPRPTAKLVEKPPPQVWCGWCGDDLPEGKTGYCNDDCYMDYVAHRVATLQKPERK